MSITGFCESSSTKLPSIILESRLHSRLVEDTELLQELISLRCVVACLADTTARSVPNFTDHTIQHMDALWRVADQVLLPTEILSMTHAEVFLLASAFYLHDIGMAYAATEEGLKRIQNSMPYRGFMANIHEDQRSSPAIQAQAMAIAVRAIHGDESKSLTVNQIPGSKDCYLFEKKSFREMWGEVCGDIASSHNWDLSRLEKDFPSNGLTPLPGGRQGDLLYVACCLRLIDFAHINRDRAPVLVRFLRGTLDEDSQLHWLAQENIDGPQRNEDELWYKSSTPISNVDAWWLYYELLKGLDQEIREVKRLLEDRKEGLKRISLVGVRGANSPEAVAKMIPTGGFLALEINLHTGSIDRLVELLAGETLYGPNPMAAIRELIQNARDAVLLKKEIAINDADIMLSLLPIKLSLTTNPPTLEIIDYGIGMTKKIITDYLIAIASSYWTSQFAKEFPQIAAKGFKNAGKFGIGFLSVFMLGSDVIVESNRVGNERYKLTLRGAGRRGELRHVHASTGSGTAIRIKLKPEAAVSLAKLQELVPVYAPALPHDLEIEVDGRKKLYRMGWIKELSVDEFQKWYLHALSFYEEGRIEKFNKKDFVDEYYFRSRFRLLSHEGNFSWPFKIPEYIDGNNRLIASFIGRSLLCLRGLTIQPVITPGFIGVIDLDSAAINISRNRAISADVASVLDEARKNIIPQIIENLEYLSQNVLLIDKMHIIAQCVEIYGSEVITSSQVPWVNLLKIPGNVEIINSSTLRTKISETKSMFICYNTGPWTAMKKWKNGETPSTENEIAILIDGEGQTTPPYQSSSSERVIGSLPQLWPNWEASPLFKTLVTLICEVWQVNQDDLTKQDGWIHEETRIFGYFRSN